MIFGTSSVGRPDWVVEVWVSLRRKGASGIDSSAVLLSGVIAGTQLPYCITSPFWQRLLDPPPAGGDGDGTGTGSGPGTGWACAAGAAPSSKPAASRPAVRLAAALVMNARSPSWL